MPASTPAWNGVYHLVSIYTVQLLQVTPTAESAPIPQDARQAWCTWMLHRHQHLNIMLIAVGIFYSQSAARMCSAVSSAERKVQCAPHLRHGSGTVQSAAHPPPGDTDQLPSSEQEWLHCVSPAICTFSLLQLCKPFPVTLAEHPLDQTVLSS